MGVLLSIFDRGSYYANYEKAFTKLEKAETRIQNRNRSRTVHEKRLTRDVMYVGGIVTLLSAVYASWVFRQDAETFTSQGRLLRLSMFVVIPLCLAATHQMLSLCFDVLKKWDERTLKRLHKSRDDMLKDIKDRNRYEKIQELLQKYDPEEQKKAKLLEQLRQPQPRQNVAKRTSIGGSLMMGAGKVIDSLANGIIGDQPELLDELKKLRSMLQELEKKNQALMLENGQLKARLPPDDVHTDTQETVERLETLEETMTVERTSSIAESEGARMSRSMTT